MQQCWGLFALYLHPTHRWRTAHCPTLYSWSALLSVKYIRKACGIPGGHIMQQKMPTAYSKFGIGNFIYVIWDQLVWDHIILKYQKSWLVAADMLLYHARQTPAGGAGEPGLTFATIRDESVETLLYLKWPLFCIMDISIPFPYIPPPPSPKITVVFQTLKSSFYYNQLIWSVRLIGSVT